MWSWAVSAEGARRRRWLIGLALAGFMVLPRAGLAHPLGNFSVNRYAGLRLGADGVELRYIVDMAEIPTFQEIQETGIAPEPDHPSVGPWASRKAEALREGLTLEVNGHRLALEVASREVIFPPGAGGLPTLKIGIRYRVSLDGHLGSTAALYYRDANFPDRAGWKEIVAVAGADAAIIEASVPDRDRSNQLADYPTDLLASPPQDVEARLTFRRELAPPLLASPGPWMAARALAPARLAPNLQATPRSAFTELMTTRPRGMGIALLALVVAAGLGAVHALEPGHGKTVVAAYLVGSRGTAWHALVLGLVVTASHTAGVYLLGAVTLYASRYIVPERLYPWLGVASGLTVAGLGIVLFLRRYRGASRRHSHDHAHDDHHHHAHHHAHGHQHHHPGADVSLKELVALGVTGGIVPCPAALVVLLSALALGRLGFGLVLIVAFSVGLAAVLIAIGLLVLHARRFMARWRGEGVLLTRWLPLTSSVAITGLGLAIAAQALRTAGILQGRL